MLFDYESFGAPRLEPRLLISFTFQESVCLHVGLYTVTRMVICCVCILRGGSAAAVPATSPVVNQHVGNMLNVVSPAACGS